MPLPMDANMQIHTTPLATRRASLADTHVITGLDLQKLGGGLAANVRPTPETGFYRDGTTADIYYVAGSGQAYLLRTPGVRALLQPAEDAEAMLFASVSLRDEEVDRELCLLAEAADAIEAERIADGFYSYRDTLYYVSLSRVFLFEPAAEGPAWKSSEVVDFPRQATALEEDEVGALMLTVWAEARTVDHATGRKPRELF